MWLLWISEVQLVMLGKKHIYEAEFTKHNMSSVWNDEFPLLTSGEFGNNYNVTTLIARTH